MNAARIGLQGLARAGAPLAVLAALSLAGTSGPGTAAAGLARGGDTPAAGTISTVAGGVGGPGLATSVGFPGGGCPMAATGGSLYIGTGGAVRNVNEQTGFLTTTAGTGDSGPPGYGGPAVNADIAPCAVALDHHANLVLADSRTVTVVARTTGTFYGQAMKAGDVYLVAGTGKRGFAGDGGPATKASFAGVEDVAVDGAGNLVIADNDGFGNQRVRVVAESSGTFYGVAMTVGDVYTVAGNGTAGFSGDGSPATAAELNQPSSVAVDEQGNLLIADAGNCRIRVVAGRTGTFYGQSMTEGDIYSIAGNGNCRFSGDGGPATQAGVLPRTIRLDGQGNILIADWDNNRIRAVAARSGTFYGRTMTAGDIYTIAGNGTAGFSGDGGPATVAKLHGPDAVGFDDVGNVIISDSFNSRIRAVAETTGTFYGIAMTAGDIYAIAGSGESPGGVGDSGFSGDRGPATSAQVFAPRGVAMDGAGDLLIADTANQRIRVVAGRTGTFFRQAMTRGDIYTVAGDGRGNGPYNGVLGTKTRVISPDGVAADRAGNLLLVGSDSQVQVVAVQAGTFYGQAMKAGFIYELTSAEGGFSGDGGPAIKARMNVPHGVAVATRTGNLAAADTKNQRIRVIAETSGTYYGKAMKAGDIYTVAGDGRRGFSGDGGPGTKASLDQPQGVAVDSVGNLVIADTGNSRIRVVAVRSGMFYGRAMTAGDIYTVGGSARIGVFEPDGVAVDSAGNLLVADTGDDQIRVLAVTTGMFYGVPMKAGEIYIVAGTIGGRGFSGDGGPGIKADLSRPAGVAAGPSGSLLIADTTNHRIREVSG